MSRFFRHDVISGIIGFVFLILVTNLALLVTALPLVLLLVTTDPARSWPLLAVAAPLAAPGVAAAFRAFREHVSGDLGPLRAFARGLRETWRAALVIGVAVTAVVLILVVDVRVLADSPVSVVTVPVLAVLAVLTLMAGLLSLVAVAEVPHARAVDVLRAALVLGTRRWYLTAASLGALAVQVAVFATAPAIGLGVTASAVLYFAWTNSRFTLRPVLDLDPVADPATA